MKKPNNCDKIRKHLDHTGSISPIEALIVHGIVRLAPRIQELRDAGVPISTEFPVDQAGHTYTRYTLNVDAFESSVLRPRVV